MGSAGRTLIVFYRLIPGGSLDGPVPPDFELSDDRARLDEADAVVIHVPTLRLLDRPRKRPGQLWVLWSIESEANHRRLRDPAYLSRFDLRMTHRRDADVIWGYVPYYSSADNLERALAAPPGPKDAERPVAMLISSRIDRSGRRAYARELARHIPIDSYGTFLRNRAIEGDTWRPSKLDVIARHPFTIAFENAMTEDYVTEKLYDPLVAGSVPIYLGAPNVDDLAPGERCLLNVRDFSSPRALAEHLHALLRDPAAYGELLAWKGRPLRPAFRAWLDRQRTPPLVRLCEAVARTLAERGR